MTAIIHAELVRSGRRRTLLIAAAVVAVFAVVATVAIFSSAGDTLGPGSNGQGATLTWTSVGATSCNGSWTGAGIPLNGSAVVHPASTTVFVEGTMTPNLIR
jgi:hypothetical protein